MSIILGLAFPHAHPIVLASSFCMSTPLLDQHPPLQSLPGQHPSLGLIPFNDFLSHVFALPRLAPLSVQICGQNSLPFLCTSHHAEESQCVLRCSSSTLPFLLLFPRSHSISTSSRVPQDAPPAPPLLCSQHPLLSQLPALHFQLPALHTGILCAG